MTSTVTPATTWQISLLGGLSATRDASKTITQFRTQRSALLLARLAHTPERFHAREELAEWLWPEEEPALQRQRLRGELSEIRTSLGEDIFQKQGNTNVKVLPSVTSDTQLFKNK